MLMKKGMVLTLVSLFVFVFASSSVLAISVSMSNTNDTLAEVTISSAVNLFSYEVNFDYGGTIGSVASANFLTINSGDATYGSDADGGDLSVFGSRLDNSGQGKSGSGPLFNITHSGSLTLCNALFIYADGTEEEKTYSSCSASSSDDSDDSSSSSGGSSTGGMKNYAILVTPSDLSILALYNKEIKREITIKNTGRSPIILTATTQGLGDTVKIQPTISLDVGESKKIPLTVLMTNSRIVVGSITLKSERLTLAEIPVLVNVKSENFLFDVGLTLVERFRRVSSGDSLQAQISLAQVGPHEKVDVTATYSIQDIYGTSFFEDTETFFVLDNKDFVKEFSTEHLPPGKYVLGMELTYPGAFATSSAQFEVVNYEVGRYGLFIGLAILVIVVVVIVSLSYFRKQGKRRK